MIKNHRAGGGRDWKQEGLLVAPVIMRVELSRSKAEWRGGQDVGTSGDGVKREGEASGAIHRLLTLQQNEKGRTSQRQECGAGLRGSGSEIVRAPLGLLMEAPGANNKLVFGSLGLTCGVFRGVISVKEVDEAMDLAIGSV